MTYTCIWRTIYLCLQNYIFVFAGLYICIDNILYIFFIRRTMWLMSQSFWQILQRPGINWPLQTGGIIVIIVLIWVFDTLINTIIGKSMTRMIMWFSDLDAPWKEVDGSSLKLFLGTMDLLGICAIDKCKIKLFSKHLQNKCTIKLFTKHCTHCDLLSLLLFFPRAMIYVWTESFHRSEPT